MLLAFALLHFVLQGWNFLLLQAFLDQSITNEVHPEYSLEGLMLKLKLQYFGHLMQEPTHWKGPWCSKDWRQEKKGTIEDEMVGWHNWLNGHEFKQTVGDSEGQGTLAGCSPCGHKESDTTEQLKNNNKRSVPPDSLEYRVPHCHPELPQGVLKVNSCSCTGFNLCRSMWQIPLASANL